MATIRPCRVKTLKLDLHNFRTPSQKSELAAIRAIISANPDWFWALTESLLDDGYHPTENIIVLRQGTASVVKEGNRRIGSLKLIHGYMKARDFEVPSHIADKIKSCSATWKKENAVVPCAIYASSEADVVDRIVALTHGKGEKAGRDKWEAVARARHSRDKNGTSEPPLDLLECYLKNGKNLTPAQQERWGGDYPLSVLEEAMKKWAARFGCKTPKEIADQYPKKIQQRGALECILLDIGTKSLTFNDLRHSADDIAFTKYGIPALATSATGAGTSSAAPAGASSSTSASKAGAAARTAKSTNPKTKAVAIDDPRSVTRTLASFEPVGKDRDKVVTLRNEAKKLKLADHPHAFCFVLRSMFELSAKAYCKDHSGTGGPSATKATGEDRTLVDVLRDVENHLTKNHTDKAKIKVLHGAMAELGKPNGLLSVTSMNQLVHNPKFSVDATHICTVFSNIFPLLEAMNS